MTVTPAVNGIRSGFQQAVINECDPLRDLHPLFDLPDHPTGTPVSAVAAFPAAIAAGGVLVRAGRRGTVESLQLFGG